MDTALEAFLFFTETVMLSFVSRGHWKKAFLLSSSHGVLLLCVPTALPTRVLVWKHQCCTASVTHPEHEPFEDFAVLVGSQGPSLWPS